MNILLTSVNSQPEFLRHYHLAAKVRKLGVFGADFSIKCDLPGLAGYLRWPGEDRAVCLSSLLEFCATHQIAMIFPGGTSDALFLARAHNDFLNAGIKLVAPDLDMAQICSDCDYLKDWLVRFGYHPVAPRSGSGRPARAELLMDIQGRPLQLALRCQYEDGNWKFIETGDLCEKLLQLGQNLRLVGHNVLFLTVSQDARFTLHKVAIGWAPGSEDALACGLNSPARLLTLGLGKLADKKNARKRHPLRFENRMTY